MRKAVPGLALGKQGQMTFQTACQRNKRKVLWSTMVRAVKKLFGLSLVALVVAGCTGSGSSSVRSGNSPDRTTSASSVGQSYQDLRVVETLPAPTGGPNAVEQPIAPDDTLEVDVFQVDELDKTVRVDSRGLISLPLIGSVSVAGKSAAQVEQELERRYAANYLQSPDISVFVKESAGLQVTMDGEFREPGVYPTTSQSTLLRAVAQAGGIADLGDEEKLYVFRQYGNQKLVANYSLKEIREGNKKDPRLFGGDTVVAFTSDSKVAAKNLREALGIASSAARVATPF